MEKKLFVPELGANVAYDDSWPADYVQQMVSKLIREKGAQQAQQPKPGTNALGQLWEAQKGVWSGAAQGIAAVPSGLGGILDNQTLKDIGETIRNNRFTENFKANPGYEDSIARQGGEIAGNLATMLGPGMAASALKAPALLARLAGPAMGMLQGSAEQVQRAQENRAQGMEVSPEEETSAARWGTAPGLLEFLPAERLLGRLAPKGLNMAREAAESGFRKQAGRAIGTGLIEAPVETLQNYLQNQIEGRYNEQQDPYEGTVENFVGGFGAGAVLEALAGARARRVGKDVMARRERVPSQPVAPLAGVDSVAVRSGEGGDPLIEMLAGMTPEQPTRPMMEMPRGYNVPKKEVVTPPAPKLNAKQQAELDAQAYNERMQALIPDAPTKVGAELPVENYGQKVKAGPAKEITLEDVIQQGTAPPSPLKPRPGQPIPRVTDSPLPDVSLTDEGVVAAPSPLAFAQKKERFVPGEYTGPDVPTIQQREEALRLRQEAEVPLLDQVVAQPVEPRRQRPGMPAPAMSEQVAGVPAILTDEGTIAEPSKLAMDQPGAPRFSLDEQPTTPTTYTVDGLRQEIEAGTKPEIALDVFAEMKALGVDDLLSTRLIDSIPNAQGSYADRVVQLALSGKSKADLLRTLNHEAVHGMKEMGLFNDAEWAILNKSFNPNTSLTPQEKEQYAKLYGGNAEMVNEEAVARGIEKYAAGQINADLQAVSIVGKVLGTVDRLGNVLRGKGFQNTNDVLQSFRTGDIGSRPANVPPPPPTPRTLKEYEKTAYGNSKIPNGTANQPVVQPKENLGSGTVNGRSTELEDFLTEDQATEAAGEIRYSYAGEGAYAGTPDADRMAANRKAAQDMEASGKSPDSIRLATGWFKSPYDKKWRTEVADDTATLTPAFAALPESKLFSKEESLPLGQVLDHPELFKAYPELKDVKVVKRSGFLDSTGGLQGSFNPESNTLTITPYAKDPGSTILHEMQHWIQSKEGFATGGNEDMAVKALSPKKMERLAGEALKKKEAELERTAARVEEQSSAVMEAGKYKGEIEELNRLNEDSMSAYRRWKKTEADADKSDWLALQDKEDKFKQRLAKRISRSDGDGRFPTIDELMRVSSLKSASQSSLDAARKSLVRLQQEVADIRSGDPKALERAVKQSGAAYDSYKNIAGEIEARDVQARQKYTPEERKAKRPMESEVINPDDVITVGSGAIGERYSIVPQLPVEGGTAFAKPDERSQLQKTKDAFIREDKLGGIGLKLRQGILDMWAGVAELGYKAGDTTARSGSEAAVRNADASIDMAAAGLKNGAVKLIGTPGNGYFKAAGDSKNAPAVVFKEAYENGKLDRLFHYLAASRGEKLLNEGREKKITPQQIATWSAYGRDPQVADYAKRWKAFNDEMVDTWKASGYLNAETAAKFKKDLYLPFYRVADDGEVNFQSSGSSMASTPRIERLKGSELEIGDPTDNIVRNVNMITSMAMKNVAMQRVARDGLKTGYIKQVPKPVPGKPNMKVWVDGKEKHFEVLDPILYQSITSSRLPSSTALKIAAFPSNTLRFMVTHDPVFMINNPVRDSTMAWLQGYTDFPMQQILKSAAAAIKNRPSFQSLEQLGIVGGGIRGEGGAASTGANLRSLYAGDTGLKGYKNKLDKFSNKSEGLTRDTVYRAVMERTGGDEAQAQYEARELLNFGRRGNNKAVQLVNALIPFQNAAWQGADVLYRAGIKGRGANPQMQKQLGTRMATMAALSALYTVAASQMPAWQNATDEERDANWFIPMTNGDAIKIKIPFEAGYIAKVVPERLVAMYMGHDTGKEFLAAFDRFIDSTMKRDVIPQAMKPYTEVTNNFSTFRGKSIEPEYMRDREKSQRFDENTSELAKEIGKHTDQLSPLQIEHLLRGYGGALGIYGTQLLSLLINPDKAAASLSMDEKMPHDLPVLGRFFQRGDSGKELATYYETTDKGVQAKNALKAGLEPTDERVGLAQYEKAQSPIYKRIQAINKREKAVREAMNTGAMDPGDARAMLRDYREAKLELAKQANEMSKPLR